MRVEEHLGDGSWMVVDQVTPESRSVLVSRVLHGGLCVWGQAFTVPPDEEWPGVRVEEVMASMRDVPHVYNRRDLWTETGQAVPWQVTADVASYAPAVPGETS